jgi:hypothetical protein
LNTSAKECVSLDAKPLSLTTPHQSASTYGHLPMIDPQGGGVPVDHRAKGKCLPPPS